MTGRVSTDLAYRLRFKSFFPLNPKSDYEDDRVKEIAVKQGKLWDKYYKYSDEMLELDKQLIAIYDEDHKDPDAPNL